MNTTSQTGVTRKPELREGPGQLLTQARADLRLTQEEVAARLHLATRQIQMLEEDDYSGLPGATYVRGYLRSYALLLGLDPEMVLKAHSRLTAKPAMTTDFSTITPQKQITSHHHQIRFVTYVVTILVIGLAIAWWQSRDVQLPSPVPLAQPEATAAPVNDASDPVVAAAPQASLAATVPVQTAVPANKPAESQPAVPAVAPVVTATPPIATNAPRVRFVLYADQDAWADIRDARQTKLLYEIVAAGRSIPLEGAAPISVFLGNPGGTRIEVNGAPVDIERYRRGVTARFSLSETAAVPAH